MGHMSSETVQLQLERVIFACKVQFSNKVTLFW